MPRPGQIIVYMNCIYKGCLSPWYITNNNFPPIQNHTLIVNGLLHDRMPPELLLTAPIDIFVPPPWQQDQKLK